MRPSEHRRRIGMLACAAVVAASSCLLPARAAAAGLEGVPAYSHIIVVIMENESYSATYGPNSPATYLNGTLVPQGVLDDHYDATGHASLDNYIAMTSGQPGNVADNADCLSMNLYTCAQAVSANPTSPTTGSRNIADQAEAAGLSWTAYMDSMPSPCFHADYSPTAGPDPYQGDSTSPPAGNYADRHNPFNYYSDIVGDDARCHAHVLPYTALSTDLATGTLANYVFISPDTCHDGHDNPCAGGAPGGLVSLDAWLQQNMPPLLSYVGNPANNALVLLTTDEGASSDTTGCCTGGPGGAPGAGGVVGMLAIGANLKVAGTLIHTSYDHASQLRTVEDALGIGEHLDNAGTASPMLDFFA